jgi:hypothetical protein
MNQPALRVPLQVPPQVALDVPHGPHTRASYRLVPASYIPLSTKEFRDLLNYFLNFFQLGLPFRFNWLN